MPIKFKKKLISTETFESCAVFDVNGDGFLDIVSGEFWYQGPDFKQKYEIGNIMRVGEYFDVFGEFPLDINGNGRADYVTGGWWGNTLRWRENPGQAGKLWQEHVIAEVGNVEAVCAWDLDGDGVPEIVPNVPGGPVVVYKLKTDTSGRGVGEFIPIQIFDAPQGHGVGCGDIAGNGRRDLVLASGWLEAPEKPWEQPWVFHDDWTLGSASVPIVVADFNHDGVAEIIVGQAHDYGLDWWQRTDTASAQQRWTKHPIDPFCSQYHNLIWADIDGDGYAELITGKRYRAHCGKDPGAEDEIGIYYFKWNGESFTKMVVSHGPPGVGVGCGISFAVADLHQTGRLDIIAPGKDGLFVFYNQGAEGSSG